MNQKPLIQQLFDFLHSDIPLKIVAFLVLCATVALPIVQENEPWYIKLIEIVIGTGAALGISSTTSRLSVARAQAAAAKGSGDGKGPASAAMLILVIAAAALSLLAVPAQAQTPAHDIFTGYSFGPEFSVTRVFPKGPGGSVQEQILSGGGARVSFGFFPADLNIPFLPGTGLKEYDVVSLELGLIGQLSSLQLVSPGGELSLAPGIGFLNDLLGLCFFIPLVIAQPGYPTAGLLYASTPARIWSFGVHLGFQFDAGAALPMAKKDGYHLPRGNTIFLSN